MRLALLANEEYILNAPSHLGPKAVFSSLINSYKKYEGVA